MANIGKPKKIIEVVPLTEPVIPEPEPVPVEPVKEPEKEPVPA